MPLDQLEKLINNLSQFSFEAEQTKIIEENKDVLADLQAEQWGSISKDYADRDIKLLDNPQYDGGYRPFTIKKKKTEGTGLGRVTNRITLFQTGALYRELFTTITSGKYLLSSEVPYFKKLMKRTGDVTGLDEERRLKFAESYVLPGVKEVLKQKTGLIF